MRVHRPDDEELGHSAGAVHDADDGCWNGVWGRRDGTPVQKISVWSLKR